MPTKIFDVKSVKLQLTRLRKSQNAKPNAVHKKEEKKLKAQYRKYLNSNKVE